MEHGWNQNLTNKIAQTNCWTLYRNPSGSFATELIKPVNERNMQTFNKTAGQFSTEPCGIVPDS